MSKCHWKLAWDEYEFIKGEVCHLFMKLNIKCIPVSGTEIAGKMKIRIVYYSSLSGKKLECAYRSSDDGFCIEDNGKTVIFVNDIDYGYERQNWTILHEIGHIVLDHTGNTEHEEEEADFFAKYAIAPPVLVDKISAHSPVDIYEAFDISMQAATYAFTYYRAWKKYHNRVKRFSDYEKRIMALFA